MRRVVVHVWKPPNEFGNCTLTAWPKASSQPPSINCFECNVERRIWPRNPRFSSHRLAQVGEEWDASGRHNATTKPEKSYLTRHKTSIETGPQGEKK